MFCRKVYLPVKKQEGEPWVSAISKTEDCLIILQLSERWFFCQVLLSKGVSLAGVMLTTYKRRINPTTQRPLKDLWLSLCRTVSSDIVPDLFNVHFDGHLSAGCEAWCKPRLFVQTLHVLLFFLAYQYKGNWTVEKKCFGVSKIQAHLYFRRKKIVSDSHIPQHAKNPCHIFKDKLIESGVGCQKWLQKWFLFLIQNMIFKHAVQTPKILIFIFLFILFISI